MRTESAQGQHPRNRALKFWCLDLKPMHCLSRLHCLEGTVLSPSEFGTSCDFSPCSTASCGGALARPKTLVPQSLLSTQVLSASNGYLPHPRPHASPLLLPSLLKSCDYRQSQRECSHSLQSLEFWSRSPSWGSQALGQPQPTPSSGRNLRKEEPCRQSWGTFTPKFPKWDKFHFR